MSNAQFERAYASAVAQTAAAVRPFHPDIDGFLARAPSVAGMPAGPQAPRFKSNTAQGRADLGCGIGGMQVRHQHPITSSKEGDPSPTPRSLEGGAPSKLALSDDPGETIYVSGERWGHSYLDWYYLDSFFWEDVEQETMSTPGAQQGRGGPSSSDDTPGTSNPRDPTEQDDDTDSIVDDLKSLLDSFSACKDTCEKYWIVSGFLALLRQRQEMTEIRYSKGEITQEEYSHLWRRDRNQMIIYRDQLEALSMDACANGCSCCEIS